MKKISRRTFLSAAAAAAATGVATAPSFAHAISRALATPANTATNSIKDLEHIVILMQENRSFDHYFGCLSGVRGFNDPRAIALPSGKPVWYQPNGGATLLPYHFDIRNTNALRVGLDHSWKGSEATWKDWNVWVAKKTVRTMGYFNRADLPFYYALADAFTTCDAYHCSVFGPTDPNRFYALSGQSPGNITGLAEGTLYNVTGGIYNADIANDNASARGIEWKTYAETLESNGVSWKVYQEWDNYGDNYLQYFRNFRVDANGNHLTTASPLYQKARAYAPGSTASNASGTTGQYLIDQFAADVRNNTLPKVSWICAPTEYCEHPSATPNAGENFTARLLSALVDNPEVWSKTALILTYDENDGYFDHMPSYIPPLTAARGRTTLTNATHGEVYNGESIGLGPRVPVLVISPWSKGGRVCSELYDHTSLIRFMEEWLVQGQGLLRSKVECANISPWRRAVCGDMTRAFNFASPNTDVSSVPRTATYFKGWGSSDALPPATQTLPKQESTTRPVPSGACPLPYRSVVEGAMTGTNKQYALNFANNGSAAAAFLVYSKIRTDGPWHYTVEANKRIDNEIFNWTGSDYHLAVHSQNGYMREFAGRFSNASRGAEVGVTEDAAAKAVRLNFQNNSSTACRFKLVDMAYGDHSVLSIDVLPGQAKSMVKTLDASYGWYDLAISIEGDANYLRRYAGHIEGAGLDFTDPVLNGLATVTPTTPPGSAISFTCPVTQIRVGESVSVSWTNLPANAKNWIGFYKVGNTPGSVASQKWSYISTAEGSISFSGLAEGSYFIGLFLNDGYQEAAARLALAVVQ
ncbi:MAG: phospholipase C, phosphocholine-specific [Pseudomonadota bacterium]